MFYSLDGTRRWLVLVLLLLMATLAPALSGCTEGASPTTPAATEVSTPPTEEVEATSPVALTPTTTPSPPPEATAAPPQEEDARPVASVNGVSISSSLYERRLALALAYRVAAQGAGARGEIRQQVLQQLIEEELMRQLAQARGVSLPDQVIDAQVEALRARYPDGLETWLAESGLEPADLRAQIEGQLLRDALCIQVTQDLPREAEQVQVAHILVSQDSLAEEIVARLRGGESFAALAEQYSEDPTTGAQGDDLGFLPRGIMPPAFDEAAFALPVGGTSDVVRSSTGYHVIRVLAHEDQRPVHDALWPAYRQQACQTWLEQQLDQAQVSVFMED